MKKTVSCILSAAALFSLCLTGCNRENPETAEFEIWSTYATAKVGQSALNNGNFVKEDAKFDVQMMKNETEGGQIIITAAKDYDFFDLEISDLKSADGLTFPAGNVTAYQEKYVQVRQKRDYNDVYVIGGAMTYHTLLPYCDEALVTKVEADGEATVFFDDLDALANWSCESESPVVETNGYKIKFTKYVNSDKRTYFAEQK